jgi:hypothetical protein
MQIQSKALPQSFSVRRSFQSFAASAEAPHPMLVFAAMVLLTLFAIVQIDLHAVQFQVIGLLGHAATGIDPVFLSP